MRKKEDLSKLGPGTQAKGSNQNCDHLKRINDLRLSDAGNAEAFILLYGQTVRFCHDQKKWYIFADHRWQVDESGKVKDLAIKVMRKRCEAAQVIRNPSKKREAIRWANRSESNFRLNSLLEIAKSFEAIQFLSTRFDENKYLLGCRNGIVDLKLGKLLQGVPENNVSKTIKIEYNPTAKCDRWSQFMLEIFNYDMEIVGFVQQAVGYSLTGDTSEQVFFMLVGSGGNGKSTFLDIIRLMFGEYAEVATLQTFEAAKSGSIRQTNDIAKLYGARLVAASETRVGAKFDESRIKQLTGDEGICARFLYQENFTYVPTFKVWLSLNHRPKVEDISDAFWRRVICIPFTQQFIRERRDKELKECLLSELPGIFNWALEGCSIWQDRKLSVPEKILKEGENYKAENNTVMRFMEECTEKSQRDESSHDLYASYYNWCASNGEQRLSHKVFGEQLTNLGYQRKKDPQTRRTKYSYLRLLHRPELSLQGNDRNEKGE